MVKSRPPYIEVWKVLRKDKFNVSIRSASGRGHSLYRGVPSLKEAIAKAKQSALARRIPKIVVEPMPYHILPWVPPTARDLSGYTISVKLGRQ